MQQYVRPEILATYTEEELVEEAAVCGGATAPRLSRARSVPRIRVGCCQRILGMN